MSAVQPSAQVIPGRPAATRRAVTWSYAALVLLPLFGAPVLGQAIVWVVENPLGSRGHATACFVVAALMGWCLACAGTYVLSGRFRDDRTAERPNGAREWHRAAVFLLVVAWVPVALILLVALGLAIGLSGARS